MIDDSAPQAPLLFLDSGLGGLSVLAAVRAALPHAPFIYVADYAGLPYGEKSEMEVATRVCALLGRLVERYRPTLAVIACNTASTIALPHARAVLDIPVVGAVPAIKLAAEASRTRTIGLLGTAATLRQPYVANLSRLFASDCRILAHAAPALVTAAEARLRGEPADHSAVTAAISALRDQPGGAAMDTLVLGCTHFPLLRAELAAAAGPDVQLFDGSAGIARRVAALTAGQDWNDPNPSGWAIFTASADHVPPPLSRLAGFGIGGITML